MFKSSKAAIIESIFSSKLSPELFERFTQFIEQRCGIRIENSRQNMLEGRLRKRLRHLLLPTFEDYARYLFKNDSDTSDELIQFFDVITTNKTEFFREAFHFDYLSSTVLPEFMKRSARRHIRTFRLWSAGCSTGEEPYSLAIALNEFAGKNPEFSYAILATDLCSRVLHQAKTGVYDVDQLAEINPELRRKYFFADQTLDRHQVRVAAALRDSVVFKRVNFLQPSFPIKEPLQAIFCRNVMIYFDRPTREQLVNRLAEKLEPGGWLFTGHSESLAGFRMQLKPVSAAVYQKLR